MESKELTLKLWCNCKEFNTVCLVQFGVKIASSQLFRGCVIYERTNIYRKYADY